MPITDRMCLKVKARVRRNSTGEEVTYGGAAPLAAHPRQALGGPTRLLAVMTLRIGRKVAFPPVMVLDYV